MYRPAIIWNSRISDKIIGKSRQQITDVSKILHYRLFIGRESSGRRREGAFGKLGKRANHVTKLARSWHHFTKFGGFVLGCIGADFERKYLFLQLLTRSLRLAYSVYSNRFNFGENITDLGKFLHCKSCFLKEQVFKISKLRKFS